MAPASNWTLDEAASSASVSASAEEGRGGEGKEGIRQRDACRQG